VLRAGQDAVDASKRISGHCLKPNLLKARYEISVEKSAVGRQDNRFSVKPLLKNHPIQKEIYAVHMNEVVALRESGHFGCDWISITALVWYAEDIYAIVQVVRLVRASVLERTVEGYYIAVVPALNELLSQALGDLFHATQVGPIDTGNL
jgi:hypothetical protein